MNRILLMMFCLGSFLMGLNAQPQDVKTMQETAKAFMKQGDNANAILVLNKALEQQPGNLELSKDLVFAYYLQHDYSKALEKGKPLPDRSDADVQCYQLLGMVYKAIEERKECEKLYKKGIKAFPESGVLYSEYGEMLWSKQNYDAIQQWEKGIEVDPNYSGNYYHAAKHYYLTTDKVWGLIYGELFVNLESYSKRTAEIKNLLLEGYKKFFTVASNTKQTVVKNDFVNAFVTTVQKQESLTAAGIGTATLTMIRTRFILDWYNSSNGNSYPFRLFEYHRQLLKEGNFEAYNQWLFGTSENLMAYQQWTSNHTEQYQQFNQFQKNRVFKLPFGQYYQTKQ